MRIRFYFVLTVFFAVTESSFSQILVGPTIGGQYSWVKFGDKDYKSSYKVNPVWGYHAGATVSFRVRKRFFLTSSLLYSTKGKVVEGKTDQLLRHEVTYNFIELPIIYSVDFKAKFANNQEFKYFLGIGPNVSYWLGGKGKLFNTDYHENGLLETEFNIVFNKEENEIEADEEAVRNANRIQLGLNAAAGIVVEPMPSHKFMFVVRYELGHSFYSAESDGDFYGTTYKDNLRTRNQGLRASIIYLMDLKTDQRKKGKSTIKRSRLH